MALAPRSTPHARLRGGTPILDRQRFDAASPRQRTVADTAPAPQPSRSLPHQADDERRIADALVRVAEEAGETLALPEVLERLCRLSRELVPCDRASVYLWSRRRSAYVAAADQGTPPAIVARAAGRAHRPGEILHEQALRRGEVVLLS